MLSTRGCRTLLTTRRPSPLQAPSSLLIDSLSFPLGHYERQANWSRRSTLPLLRLTWHDIFSVYLKIIDLTWHNMVLSRAEELNCKYGHFHHFSVPSSQSKSGARKNVALALINSITYPVFSFFPVAFI